MKKIFMVLFVISILMLSACSGFKNNNSISETEVSTNSQNINTSNISDDQAIELLNQAYNMAISSETFEFNSDGKLYNSKNETITQYINRFNTLFSDNYTYKYFDLFGYVRTDNDKIQLNLNQRYNDTEIFDHANYIIKFNDITDETNYLGYDFVRIGGFGDRGSDMSFISNKITVSQRKENEIILTNKIWHITPDIENIDYVCHFKDGKIVIDGDFERFDKENDIPIFTKCNKTGEELTVSEKQKNNYYVSVDYNYNLIFENGKWKFDNFVYWG